MLSVLRTVEATTMPLHQPEASKVSQPQNFIAVTIMVLKIYSSQTFHILQLAIEPNRLG